VRVDSDYQSAGSQTGNDPAGTIKSSGLTAEFAAAGSPAERACTEHTEPTKPQQ